MTNPAESILLIMMAISLSACAGLRAFLPLAALSLMAQAGYIHLAAGFEWLNTWQALAVFGLAAVLEVVADKYPGLDHALDAAGLVIKPLAGALLATSLITGMHPLLAAVLGIVVGGTTAGTLHIARAKLRLASTALTGGLGNPLLSFADDGASVAGTVLAFAAPALGAVLVLGLVAWIWQMLLHQRKRVQHRGRVEVAA
jgi:uncharacterized membrane protein